jgi:hypothetical protein
MLNLYIRDNLSILRDKLLNLKYGRIISTVICLLIIIFIFYIFTQTHTLLIQTVLLFLILILILLFFYFKLIQLSTLKVLKGYFKKMLAFIESFRWMIALLVVFVPLAFYQLSSSAEGKFPAINFDVITVSGVLGGLVLTAATFRRVKKQTSRKLFWVAIYFIIATILLVIAAVNLQLVDLLNGIDLNVRQMDSVGFSRFYSFWLGALGFYGGTYAFAYAIIDLLFSLFHVAGILRPSLKGHKQE